MVGRMGPTPRGPPAWEDRPDQEDPLEPTVPPPPGDARLTPFLMFEGRAREAIDLYVSLFDDGRVLSLRPWGPDGPGAPGTVEHAELVLAGQRVLCFDSPVPHAFGFTPALSLYVACRDRAEIDRLFAALAEGGEVLMALDDHGFSDRFGWVNDRFGVSWQLNLDRADPDEVSAHG